VNRPNTAANMNSLSRPVPARPWEQQNYGSTMGGGMFFQVILDFLVAEIA